MSPLNISVICLILLFIPCLVGTILCPFDFLDVNAFRLGVWVNVSERESGPVSRVASFEALGASRLFGGSGPLKRLSFGCIWLRRCVVGLLNKILKLPSMEKCVDNTLETLSTLDHMHDEGPLKISVVLWNIVDELLEATAYSTYQIVILDIACNSVVPDQVQSVPDMKYWDRN